MNKPAIELDFEGADDPTPTPPRGPGTPSSRFDQIFGSIRIIDAEPTWTPRGRIEDSIALLIDGGTPNLCVYDYQTRQWLFAELSTTRIP